MKELKISELMDSYVDNEVCIEGESLVDNEELKGLVMKQAKKPPLIRPAFKAAIAAMVAAVGIFAMMGFTPEEGRVTSLSNVSLSYKVMSDDEYNSMDPNKPGGNAYYPETGVFYYGFDDTNTDHLVRLEQGRIVFTGDGQHIDVTDLIDDETPYIYPYKNKGDGSQGYIVIGGTPEYFAFSDIFFLRDIYVVHTERYYVEDMAIYPENVDYEKNDEDVWVFERHIKGDRIDKYKEINPDHPGWDLWLYPAAKEIGIDMDILWGGTQDIIYFYDAETDESLFHTPYRQEIRY